MMIPSSMKSTLVPTSLANPISWFTTTIVIPESASSFITSKTSTTISGSRYKRSFKCYKDTKKLLLNAENSEDVIEIVRQYTRNFNELNRKYGQFIETEEREDIFMAMEQLYKECILGKSNNNKSRNTTKDINITLEEVLDVIEENKEDW